MLRLRGTVQAAASTERTDESPVTNKQRRHGKLCEITGSPGTVIFGYTLTRSFTGSVTFISYLHAVLLSVFVTGKLKETHSWPTPSPLRLSLSFPACLCVLCARARVSACPFSRAVAAESETGVNVGALVFCLSWVNAFCISAFYFHQHILSYRSPSSQLFLRCSFTVLFSE